MNRRSPFENLHEYVFWLQGEGKNYTCCQRATDEDIRATPSGYDCATCELAAQQNQLWPENWEALQVYNLACGRTARTCGIGGWLLEHYTEGWTYDRISALIKRLDIIAEAMRPIDIGGQSTQD